jgi:signal transduction histidine kinase
VFRGTLRSKFLFALVLISALLTWATLLLVRHRVELRVREEISQELKNSVATFRILQSQREATLERSAALLASLPPLKAVMTSQDTATIQDASTTFWNLSGSQLFVLSGRSGNLMAIHTSASGFTEKEAHEAMARSLSSGQTRDWWFGNGHLFQVFFQPISFGPAGNGTEIGVLAVGYEIDRGVAADVARVASSQVAFQYRKQVVVSTVSAAEAQDLARNLNRSAPPDGATGEMQLGHERFVVTSVRLSPDHSNAVTLTVLKSYDEATAFLQSLNRWILAIGLAAVLAGSLLVFFVSTTFTRPLAELAGGVQALEKGDYSYPLETRGNDEVSALTSAFLRMRLQLQETQRQLLDSERLATIGRMASMISHDLRRPLTAILAYAEFLSEGHLEEHQRMDFFEEIRIAVNRMTDEINSLLGFSKQREAIRPVYGRMEEVIERAIQTVKILPEYQSIQISFSHPGECAGWFDPGKVERVVLNLLFNACEAVAPDSGKIEVSIRMTETGMEITVADNGPGIPESIRGNLFQPFVTSGKEKGIGLGLTVVQKIMQNHGGEVFIESTGSAGTTFRLVFPPPVAAERYTIR